MNTGERAAGGLLDQKHEFKMVIGFVRDIFRRLNSFRY